MKSRATVVAALAAAAISLSACSKPYVRTVPWSSESDALETLARRADSIKSIRAACTLTLIDPQGESVNFDGALVVRLEPDHAWLRLRTWKLGHAVFDATVRPDGVWIMTSEEAAKRTASASQGLQSARPDHIAAAIGLLAGDFFRTPGLKIYNKQEFAVTRTTDEGSVVAFIDRDPLTVYQYSIRDNANTVRQTLHLDTYRELPPDATPFPLRIKAVGPEGSVELRLEDVELNGLIEDAAFTPPRRAVKQ
jgi:hypothetical protein